SSRRRHTRFSRDWSSDVCSSDLLDNLLQDVPELTVVVDTFEQAVQRPAKRTEADTYYSGKKRRHTLKSQVTVDGYTGHIVDVARSEERRVGNEGGGIDLAGAVHR